MKTDNTSNINLITKSIITRLEKSADKLSTEIKFTCIVCKDTGLKEQNGQYKQCDKCPKVSEEEKPNKFF